MDSIKIKFLGKGIKRVNTSEGKKELDKENCILVSTKLAKQLVDGKNWEYNNLEDVTENEENEENEEDENENNELTEIDNDPIDAEAESENIGDETISEAIKSLPGMTIGELQEMAEESGIDSDEIDGKNKKALIKIIIKTLKGK